MLFNTELNFATLTDEQLDVVLEWTQSIREASENANLPEYVAQCDERLNKIYGEITQRLCSDPEYGEWFKTTL
jgi:hypothetical protein